MGGQEIVLSGSTKKNSIRPKLTHKAKVGKVGREQWTRRTSSQSFIIIFSYSLVQQLWVYFFNLDWLVYWVSKRFDLQLQSTKGVILCIIIAIGDVHRYIGHCLIPLDPCIVRHALSEERPLVYKHNCPQPEACFISIKKGGRGHWTVNYTTTQCMVFDDLAN